MDLISDFIGLDIDFLIEQNKKKPTKRPMRLISDYVRKHRTMPPNSPFPGRYNPDITPYVIEIMDNMSPSSCIIHTTVMKGVQIGLTTGLAENTIAFYIGECPSDILFVSATEANLKKWSMKKLDPLIDSCHLRDLIQGQTENIKSRRSGDTLLMKEFTGGTLLMGSAQSPPSLRQDSVRILLRDEIDGAPTQLTTGEGDWIEVSEARTFAFGSRAKIGDISTPTTYAESNIYKQYLDGDQRKLMVPCPNCHEFQSLDWGNDETDWGIKPRKIRGKLVSVVYVCIHCKKDIKNTDKNYMLPRHKWEPTATPKDPYHRSYWLPSLYSPVGMMSWTKAYQKYLKALDDPIDGMRSFNNLIRGMPHKDEGSRPKLSKVIGLRGAYKSGTVPEGVLFLTAAADVQLGSKTNKNNPPRIEIEVCGHGAGYRTWSIDYKVFKGPVDDPYKGAYQDLFKFYEEGGFSYSQNGIDFPVQRIFIDCGADMHTNNVMTFCSRGIINAYPTKGFKFLVDRKKENLDEMTARNASRYRLSKSGASGYYQIATVFYKNAIYSTLEIERNVVPPQRPGFCDFPMDYKDNYFRMLIAEEKLQGGKAFTSGGRRNEALDCRVGNLCAAHVFLDDMLEIIRRGAISNGLSREQAKQLSVKNVLTELEKSIDYSKKLLKVD